MTNDEDQAPMSTAITSAQTPAPHPSDTKPWLWKPGQSGNPAGRPSDIKRLREMARQLGDKAIEGLLREAQTADSASARIAAWNALLDRGYGKPTVGEPDEEGRQSGGLVLRWKREGEGE